MRALFFAWSRDSALTSSVVLSAKYTRYVPSAIGDPHKKKEMPARVVDAQ
jgi:hypothetical protein